ncbi:DUF1284 domain-containing protein [Afifella pfennigii]|uniref:DUF1284 domain-containing protein n=1 Tax=Afifella pfennigii TaxID=209897 RepID=UPI00047AD45C|nr:DUF1284 domain-containing protein [Afifella pfennigii]
MTIRLRPHHLLCLLTYVGKGYSPAFTSNYDVIAGRLAQGEDVLIVAGPDDICAPLLGEEDAHCWRASVRVRDSLAARDLRRLMPGPVRAGTTITLGPELLRAMRGAFAAGKTRSACLGCQWSDLCSAVAASDYRGVVIP